MVSKLDLWDSYNTQQKIEILNKLINKPKNITFYVNYFDKLCNFYKKNTLNYFTKDIEETTI